MIAEAPRVVGGVPPARLLGVRTRRRRSPTSRAPSSSTPATPTPTPRADAHGSRRGRRRKGVDDLDRALDARRAQRRRPRRRSPRGAPTAASRASTPATPPRRPRRPAPCGGGARHARATTTASPSRSRRPATGRARAKRTTSALATNVQAAVARRARARADAARRRRGRRRRPRALRAAWTRHAPNCTALAPAQLARDLGRTPPAGAHDERRWAAPRRSRRPSRSGARRRDATSLGEVRSLTGRTSSRRRLSRGARGVKARTPANRIQCSPSVVTGWRA